MSERADAGVGGLASSSGRRGGRRRRATRSLNQGRGKFHEVRRSEAGLRPLRFIDWHTLLERVYDIDSLACPRCGAGLRFIAVLTEPEPIRAILESMGLPSTPPVPARARYPTLFEDSQLADCDVA